MILPPQHFYMIRHGQTEANATQTMAGSLDSPLTEKGIEQARRVHQILGHLSVKPQHIIHSHLSRARDTALIINEKLQVELSEDPDLAEWHVGEYEGRPWEECTSFHGGWEDAPGGETAQQFLDRVRKGKKNALKRPEKPVLIVCHGGVFRAFAKLYGLERPGVRNAHLYEFAPNAINKTFPWDIWHYDICYNGKVHRLPATISYDDDKV